MSRLRKWPLYRTYEIRHEDGLSYVTVAQATESETYRRSMYLPPEGKAKWTPRLGRMEAYLCVAAITDTPEPFHSGEGNCGTRIRYGMTEPEFDEAWDELYKGISAQIHDCVREMNPHWYNYDILSAHLSELKDQYYAWDRFEAQNKDTREADLAIRRDMGEIFPELPEFFSEMSRLKSFGYSKLPNPGGLLDQPEVYMLELSTCISLVEEREHLASKKVTPDELRRLPEGQLPS